MKIKILVKQGKSVREISRTLKISRNTVRRHLRQEEKLAYKRRKANEGKLRPFLGYLQERVKAARPEWLPATVLYREIKEQGYPGRIRILQSYLKTLKPKRQLDPIVRFETQPGQQMQVDWIVFRRGKDSLSGFVATMGYSRGSFVEFVTNERIESLLDCHEKAFEYFGGIPEEILYDNMKTVVLERDAYAQNQHRFHLGFLDFARHHGFMPRLCRPYRAKTKGKVERFNCYLRHSFYNPLASRLKPLGLVADAELANYEVKRWLRDVANQRIHATTGAIPAIRMEEERAWLKPIPGSYTGLKRARPKKPLELTGIINLQHPLSVYDSLLREGIA